MFSVVIIEVLFGCLWFIDTAARLNTLGHTVLKKSALKELWNLIIAYKKV